MYRVVNWVMSQVCPVTVYNSGCCKPVVSAATKHVIIRARKNMKHFEFSVIRTIPLDMFELRFTRFITLASMPSVGC